ncbi:hypothetical protein ElyMa_004437300 [Elysia marginata]|uniref:Uncharacterized protein n=1 Tax=Elysia marginata TaxID=1093978 RepID=A0AAV4HGB3_9GAST|nr:hypothetical protein ElyMa_004437300 [Elysia marginata]
MSSGPGSLAAPSLLPRSHITLGGLADSGKPCTVTPFIGNEIRDKGYIPTFQHQQQPLISHPMLQQGSVCLPMFYHLIMTSSCLATKGCLQHKAKKS